MKRLLSRGVPRFLDRQRPTYMLPKMVQVPSDPKPPAPGPKMPLFGLVWATWDQGDPTDFTALASSPAILGKNAAVWLDALTSRVNGRGGNPSSEIVVAGNTVSVNGEAVIDLCSMFDIVTLGHWFPPEMVTAIQARSTAPKGTKVYFWTDHESIPQNPYWVPAAAPHRDWRRNFWGLSSPTPNSYGCTCIDKYEGNPKGAGQVACFHTPAHAGLPSNSDGSVLHTWDIDIMAAVVDSFDLDAMVALYKTTMLPYVKGNGRWSVSGWMFDNVLEDPYKGQATNNYPAGWTSSIYRFAYNTFLNWWRERGHNPVPYVNEYEDPALVLWGNSAVQSAAYNGTTLPGRYSEHFFRVGTVAKTWAEIEADLVYIANTGLKVILGALGTVGQTYYWMTTSGGPNPAVNGTWQQIYAKITELDLWENVYPACWQTFTEGYVMWQEGFRQPE